MTDDGYLSKAAVRLRKAKIEIAASDDDAEESELEDATIFAGCDSQSLKDDDVSRKQSNAEKVECDFWTYLWSDLTRSYSLHNDESRFTEKQKKISAFLRIPVELEKFLFYGLLQCIEAFCHLATFLPLRLLMSFFGLFTGLRSWKAADTCDFLKALIFVICSYLMLLIDTSVMYHQVRGQGVIKLYILYNMLEVADKLFSSFGQDIFDALFWSSTAERPPAFLRIFVHFSIAIIYTWLHTILVLLQATTLNVAFNSHNQALLAIMMSNNFVELKGSVFKKFAKPNLFQMSCSDVRERFHIFTLLSVVVVRNMMAVNWQFDHFLQMLPDLSTVMLAEVIVDWLKHAFITKFNEIPAEVYQDFTITIAFDVLRSRDETAFSDYSDQVSRRMGFIPIPLTIMLFRVATQSFDFSTLSVKILFALFWVLLLSVKVLNGIVVLGKACEHVKHYRELQQKAESELFRKRVLTKKSKSVPSSPRLSLIDFSDVLHQTAANKGLTISDIVSQWEEVMRSPDSTPVPEIPQPRRTQSLATFSRTRRDNSLPPQTAIVEGEEEVSETSDQSRNTPRKKLLSECDSLSDVQAYTMLGSTNHPAEGIHT